MFARHKHSASPQSYDDAFTIADDEYKKGLADLLQTLFLQAVNNTSKVQTLRTKISSIHGIATLVESNSNRISPKAHTIITTEETVGLKRPELHTPHYVVETAQTIQNILTGQPTAFMEKAWKNELKDLLKTKHSMMHEHLLTVKRKKSSDISRGFQQKIDTINKDIRHDGAKITAIEQKHSDRGAIRKAGAFVTRIRKHEQESIGSINADIGNKKIKITALRAKEAGDIQANETRYEDQHRKAEDIIKNEQSQEWFENELKNLAKTFTFFVQKTGNTSENTTKPSKPSGDDNAAGVPPEPTHAPNQMQNHGQGEEKHKEVRGPQECKEGHSSPEMSMPAPPPAPSQPKKQTQNMSLLFWKAVVSLAEQVHESAKNQERAMAQIYSHQRSHSPQREQNHDRGYER